jgi:hypothetical protein
MPASSTAGVADPSRRTAPAKHPVPVEASEYMPPRLLCPACGGDFNHPVAVECRSPGRANGLVRVDSRGISIDSDAMPHGRGVEITLGFACEGGHRFHYVLSFHKGQTFIEPAVLPDLCSGEWPDTIWRD